MKEINIKNSKVAQSLNSIQILWLELWEELLHPASIAPYVVPPVNSRTLIEDVLAIRDNDLKYGTKMKIVKQAIKEIWHDDYGIRRDALIKKEFRSSVLGVRVDLDKSELEVLFEYLEQISRALQNGDYFHKLRSNVYETICRNWQKDELQEQDWFQMADDLNNMLRSMLVELLRAGFSHKYLRGRLAIFLQEDHYLRGNLQHKIDSMFHSFINSSVDYRVVLRLHDLVDFPTPQVVHDLELADSIPEISRFIDQEIYAIQELTTHFYEKTDMVLFTEVWSRVYNVLPVRHKNGLIDSISKVYAAIELLGDEKSLKGLLPVIKFMRALATAFDAYYYSMPEDKLKHAPQKWGWLRIPQNALHVMSFFDVKFALLADDCILAEVDNISQRKTMNYLRAYLFRLTRMHQIESEVRRTEIARKLVGPKSKILFAVCEVKAHDPFASVSLAVEQANRLLAYLQFQYGYLQGKIAKKCVVLGRNTVMVTNIDNVNSQRLFTRKSIDKPELLTIGRSLIFFLKNQIRLVMSRTKKT